MKLAALHDGPQILFALQDRNVPGGIALDEQQIRQHPRFDLPAILRPPRTYGMRVGVGF